MISLRKFYLLAGFVCILPLTPTLTMIESYISEYNQQRLLAEKVRATRQALDAFYLAAHDYNPRMYEEFNAISASIAELEMLPLSEEQKHLIRSFPLEQGPHGSSIIDIALQRLDERLLHFLIKNFDLSPENVLFILLGHIQDCNKKDGENLFDDAILMFSRMLNCSRLQIIIRLVLYGVYFQDLPCIISHLGETYHDGDRHEALNFAALLQDLIQYESDWEVAFARASSPTSYDLRPLSALFQTCCSTEHLINMRSKHSGETLLERIVDQPTDSINLNYQLTMIRYLYSMQANTEHLVREIANARKTRIDCRIKDALTGIDMMRCG